MTTLAGTVRIHVPGVGEVSLTNQERTVLDLLMAGEGTVSRASIAARLWTRPARKLRRVDNLVRRLRSKLEVDPKKPVHIVTIAGSGYAWRSRPAAAAGEPAAPVSVVALDDRVVDLATLRVKHGDQAWELTAMEARLVQFLARRGEGVVPSADIVAKLWRPGGDRRLLTNLVRKVRKKIEPEPERPRYLVVERGRGYRLRTRAAGSERARTNLAEGTADLVGRDAERAAVHAHFAGGARRVAIRGPGGVGKTHLATGIGRAWLAESPGAEAWICDVRQAGGVDAVCAALCETLGAGPGGGTAAERLLATLGRRRACLVILDGVEGASDVVEQVADWAEALSGVSFLVTSRHRIAWTEAVELAPLARDDARRLLCSRMTRPPVGDALDAILDHLHGLPLGLTRAATALETRRESQVLRALRADGSPWATAVAALADEAWAALDVDERRVLTGCTAFCGPFLTSWATAIVPDAAEALDALVDRSLLREVLDGEGRRIGFAVQPWLCAPLVARRPVPEEVLRRGEAVFVVDFEPRLFFESGTGEALRWRRDNLLEILPRLAAGEARGRGLLSLYEAAMTFGDIPDYCAWIEGELAGSAPLSPDLRACLLGALAKCAKVRGDADRAHQLHLEARAVAVDASLQAILDLLLAAHHTRRGHRAEVVAYTDEALRLAGSAGDARVLAMTHLARSDSELDAGDAEASLHHSLQGQMHAQRHGHPILELKCLMNVFRMAEFMGYTELVTERLPRGFDVLRVLERRADPRTLVHRHMFRGEFHRMAGQTAEALRAYGSLVGPDADVRIAHATRSLVRGRLGALCLAIGEAGRGIEVLEAALAASVDRGDAVEAGNALVMLAYGHFMVRADRIALVHLDRALDLALEANAQLRVAELLPFQASVLATLGRAEAARARLHEADALTESGPITEALLALHGGFVRYRAAPSAETREAIAGRLSGWLQRGRGTRWVDLSQDLGVAVKAVSERMKDQI